MHDAEKRRPAHPPSITYVAPVKLVKGPNPRAMPVMMASLYACWPCGYAGSLRPFKNVARLRLESCPT